MLGNEKNMDHTIVADLEEADMVNHLQGYCCLDHYKFPSNIINYKRLVLSKHEKKLTFDRLFLQLGKRSQSIKPESKCSRELKTW